MRKKKYKQRVEVKKRCPACTLISLNPRQIVFKRFHLHELEYRKYEGFECNRCGHLTIEEEL